MRNVKIGQYRLFTFILVSYLLLASNAYSETYNFTMQWGSQGINNGQFAYPEGITVDASGNVYVSDGANDRIEKFDSNGNYITQWGGYGTYLYSGLFNGPAGLATDKSGNVFVIDFGNDRIQQFDSSGNYITQWGVYGTGDSQFQGPVSIAFDSTGNIYVADCGNNRIQKFTSQGSYITQWGYGGTGNGQFNHPYGIALDASDNIYVVDNANHRVQKFTSQGTYITQWGSQGFGNGQFFFPAGIAIDTSGNVYVADEGSYRIQKFDSNGNYITQWGSYGNGNGQFSSIGGLALDTSGNVYVTDIYNNRVQKFAPVMSIPTGQNVYTYAPVQSPVVGATPQSAKPLAVGPLAAGGNTLSLTAGLPGLSGKADVYIVLALNGKTYFIMPDLSFSQTPSAWQSGTSGPINASLYGGIPLAGLPHGTYTLYFAVTPSGSKSNYYIWGTQFTVQ